MVSKLLPGKVVAITGCSTGIGRAVALGRSTLPDLVLKDGNIIWLGGIMLTDI